MIKINEKHVGKQLSIPDSFEIKLSGLLATTNVRILLTQKNPPFVVFLRKTLTIFSAKLMLWIIQKKNTPLLRSGTRIPA